MCNSGKSDRTQYFSKALSIQLHLHDFLFEGPGHMHLLAGVPN